MNNTINWLLTIVETELHTAREVALSINPDIMDDAWVEFPMEYREQISGLLGYVLQSDDVIVDIRQISDVAVIKKLPVLKAV